MMVPPGTSDRFWSKVEKRGADECWPWMAAVRRKDEGYGAFWFKGRHHPAPRIAAILSGATVPLGFVVCHRCDNPRCCNPAHLFIGRPQDNDADRVAKGRQAKGARNGHAKLTDRIVATIRALRKAGAKPAHLGNIFRISPTTVWDLCNRGWRHVDDRKELSAALEAWRMRNG